MLAEDSLIITMTDSDHNRPSLCWYRWREKKKKSLPVSLAKVMCVCVQLCVCLSVSAECLCWIPCHRNGNIVLPKQQDCYAEWTTQWIFSTSIAPQGAFKFTCFCCHAATSRSSRPNKLLHLKKLAQIPMLSVMKPALRSVYFTGCSQHIVWLF